MKRILLYFITSILALVGLTLSLTFRTPAPTSKPDTDFVLKGILVFDPKTNRFDRLDLRFENSKIAEVSDSSSSTNSEFSNMTATPGLADMHAHLPPNNLLDLIPYFSLLYLSHGVTVLRVAGDIDGTSVPYAKDGISKNLFFGPKIFSCDAFVTAGIPRWKNSIVVESPEQAAQAVRTLEAKGADCIKSYENLTVPMIRALVKSAQERNLTVLGHVPFGLTYEEASIPDVQHFFGVPRPDSIEKNTVVHRGSDWENVDEKLLNDIVIFSKLNRIANTPTLVASERLLSFLDYDSALLQPSVLFMPRFFREIVWNPIHGIPAYRNLDPAYLRENVEKALRKKMRLVYKLFQAGAELRLGSDTQQPFVVPGDSLQREMKLFQKAGIPSEEVWNLATIKAHESLKNFDSFRIRPGTSPDLLLFRKNPVSNLENLSSLYAVVAQGRLYRKKDLDLLLEEHKRRFENPIYETISFWLGKIVLEKQTKEFQN
ncbi:amidohydrolase family protein [Leptospira gomenensis]|uniref:amidohydrolase family protein n=1 Tax=Leptospira gomenensis TaxID=2484974 RepID=UPI0014383C5A|nr:amidohydrolase family protein [Leptospira gomenensis]